MAKSHGIAINLKNPPEWWKCLVRKRGHVQEEDEVW
jgi:hypothetical protein